MVESPVAAGDGFGPAVHQDFGKEFDDGKV